MRYLVCLLGLLFAVSCQQNKKKEVVSEPVDIQAQLLEYNKRKIQEEDALIASHAEASPIGFTVSDTGMRYKVFSGGNNNSIKVEDIVGVQYTMRLLDSTLCYENWDAEPLVFKVAKTDVAAGFHELVQKMCPNDSAVAIWPARLGFGVAGDSKKIPQDAILLVDLKVLQN